MDGWLADRALGSPATYYHELIVLAKGYKMVSLHYSEDDGWGASVEVGDGKGVDRCGGGVIIYSCPLVVLVVNCGRRVLDGSRS